MVISLFIKTDANVNPTSIIYDDKPYLINLFRREVSSCVEKVQNLLYRVNRPLDIN